MEVHTEEVLMEEAIMAEAITAEAIMVEAITAEAITAEVMDICHLHADTSVWDTVRTEEDVWGVCPDA